ncbi:fructose-bisphosphatase class III [Liquorilactobacillus capillatus]|uniref:Fructose-1,6-bisphosphatase class 3 n=1 Tax=Liquorilactobacillus capillatus DSM 19910 TaxID=1423731 RepID=A0A0R1M7C7_9LACO|nr:fructose-bisphosphatase class III [Liquorilactobacillus capillatus]KRL00917.1 fructose-1,6-bisphosphatase [Liquorilactobacillus capillatus DSM 19910]
MSYTQELLREKFPAKQDVVTEITNLEAILNLPKATEHFVSDVHGEYNAFDHTLRNGSGNVKQKIIENFGGRLTPHNIQEFATLIYYPEDKLIYRKKHVATQDELDQWYLNTIARLIEVLKITATKYTRSKVRKAMDPNYVYITEELLYNDRQELDKRNYYNQILHNLVALHQADEFITVTCYTIQRLVVDHLHVIGDIYDRGPAPDKIMDTLMSYHSVDIQWGNHDIIWLGAVSGSALCIMNLLRICARYNNLAIIEDAYGINLRHLSMFAEHNYMDVAAFRPKTVEDSEVIRPDERKQITQIHQAVAMIQFKLEGQICQRRPEFKMKNVTVLDKIDYKKGEIELGGKRYPLTCECFATIDPEDPYKLTAEEEKIIQSLLESFRNATKLRKHLDFMMEKGSMYKCYNGNLLFHGCIPVEKDGSFRVFEFKGQKYQGKELFDFFEKQLYKAYNKPEVTDDLATDMLWYLWQGPLSPLFGKHAMTTFARYFIEDKETHLEKKNAYYNLRKEEWFCRKLLQEFGLDPEEGHIINGHTPVKKGRQPIMANKKMIVIDGGYSKAYQPTTGIGGYTLLYNSYGLQLVTHHPFTSKEDAIKNGRDILSTRRVVNQELKRQTVADTDTGREIKEKLHILKKMLADYKQN